MSRVLNLDIAMASVAATCLEKKYRVSAIETLLSGGTRVVCASSVDAAGLRKQFRAKIIEGPVRRTPLALAWGRY